MRPLAREQPPGRLARALRRAVGYVGMGRIAQAVAERLVPFGCPGIYTDPAVRLGPECAMRLGLRAGSFDEVLAAADVLTLHVPLTDETSGLIGRAAIGRMKPGAIVVNTAGGGSLDEAALAEALRSGHLLAAGLDVFEREPRARDNPLLALPGVVLTPHISAGTRNAMRQKMEAVFGNLRRYFAGGDLRNRVSLP